jgi:hypothetical protein
LVYVQKWTFIGTKGIGKYFADMVAEGLNQNVTVDSPVQNANAFGLGGYHARNYWKLKNELSIAIYPHYFPMDNSGCFQVLRWRLSAFFKRCSKVGRHGAESPWLPTPPPNGINGILNACFKAVSPAESCKARADSSPFIAFPPDCPETRMPIAMTSEKLLPSRPEKLRFQRPTVSPAYHCSRCGATVLKIIFKVDGSKIHPYFQCQECQMSDRISWDKFYAMNTQDIEDTLREFALCCGEENVGNIPQGFANRLTGVANDMKRHREFCEIAVAPDSSDGNQNQTLKLKMAIDDSVAKKWIRSALFCENFGFLNASFKPVSPVEPTRQWGIPPSQSPFRRTVP